MRLLFIALFLVIAPSFAADSDEKISMLLYSTAEDQGECWTLIDYCSDWYQTSKASERIPGLCKSAIKAALVPLSSTLVLNQILPSLAKGEYGSYIAGLYSGLSFFQASWVVDVLFYAYFAYLGSNVALDWLATHFEENPAHREAFNDGLQKTESTDPEKFSSIIKSLINSALFSALKLSGAFGLSYLFTFGGDSRITMPPQSFNGISIVPEQWEHDFFSYLFGLTALVNFGADRLRQEN